MFTKLEALSYRCLHHVSQRLGGFHILVGPNASGKSTFLDGIRVLSDILNDGLESAVQGRAQDWKDLVWQYERSSFELALEVEIPARFRDDLQKSTWNTCRYQVRIGQDDPEEPLGFLQETLLLKASDGTPPVQRNFFPEMREAPSSILERTGRRGTKVVVNKVQGGKDNFYDETGTGWDHSFMLGPQRSALANVPEDETKFPVASWFKRLLSSGIEFIHLDSDAMRVPSPPGKGRVFLPDGSNLPWVLRGLQEKSKDRVQSWLEHVRTALPDVRDLTTHVRDEDRHCYLRLHLDSGVAVPSWGLSDGTLRLLALTLIPYLPEASGTYLIEEPENGIHPRAVESIYHSLSSVYDAQVLVATHSPVFLSVASVDELLCFARDERGATDVVAGDEHPKLRSWRQEVDIGSLFAAGVLG